MGHQRVCCERGRGERTGCRRSWGGGAPALGQKRCRSGPEGAAGRVSRRREPGASPGEDDRPFSPSARWGRLGGGGRTDQEAVPGLGEPPLPVSAGAECRVHGHVEAGLWREGLGSGSCLTPTHWSWGPETAHLSEGSPGRTAHRGRTYSPFDFQPFQESARPPPGPSGTVSFSCSRQCCRRPCQGGCHRQRMGLSACWPGWGARASLPGPSGRAAPVPGCPAAGSKRGPGRLLSLGAHLPPGSGTGAACPDRVKRE